MAKVRFAPSPTGKLHLGNTRTAIYNWLYARHTKGTFVLRIEDTDKARSSEEFTLSVMNDMKWLGMDHDEFYKQSDRFDLYYSYIEKLLADGKAYYCTCEKEDLIERNHAKGIFDEATKYDGHCRNNHTKPDVPHVVRLDIGPERDIIFQDVVRKRIRVNTKELDDFVLWKSDGSPTYNFAVVIDDALMKISHVIRGEDHITNTAKQIVLYEYLGFELPIMAHLPLVFDTDHTRLSKRKGSTNIEDYRKRGLLPQAIINYIARLGWSYGNEEIFTVGQLVEYFDIEKLSKSNAVYDEDKMFWLNGKHIRMIAIDELANHFEVYIQSNGLEKAGRMTEPGWLTTALGTLRERNDSLETLYNEMLAYAEGKYEMTPEAKAKFDELTAEDANKQAFEEARAAIDATISAGNFDDLEKDLRQIAERFQVKFGTLVQMLRIVLSGNLVSPDIISVIKLLGSSAINRLNAKL